MLTFWYPAIARTGIPLAKYVEPQVAMADSPDYGYDFSFFGGGSDFRPQVAAFFSHSLSNAPLATDSVQFPVVLYDPGELGQRRENTDKTEDLASWGYVVVGLDTADSYVSVFPDGTIIDGQPNSSVDGIEGRLLDMEFVLDQLETLNAGDGRLGGRLALDRIGAFGWSLGGATAAQLCLRDARCKAGSGMDGFYFETNLLAQPIGVPWLFFAEDGPTPVPGLNPPDDRLEVFDKQLTNAYWVKIASTVHGSFADFDLILDSDSLKTQWAPPTSGRFLPPARVSQIVRSYELSFFNKFLLGVDDHLLDGPSPQFPEVEQFIKK
jgi:dienelactone hydrolase